MLELVTGSVSSFQDIWNELLTVGCFTRPLEGAQDALTLLLRSSPTHSKKVCKFITNSTTAELMYVDDTRIGFANAAELKTHTSSSSEVETQFWSLLVFAWQLRLLGF